MASEKFYRLDSFENNKYTSIKVISLEEYEKVYSAQKIVLEFNRQFLYYIYFNLNYLEYDAVKKSMTNFPIANLDIQMLLSTNFYMSVNRVVFNLLQSFKFFLDGSETYAKRILGEKQHEDLKARFSCYFDNYFAYRFLSKLRNYSQHIAFPIQLLPLKGIENAQRPETMRGDVKMMVDKSQLIKEADLFGKIVMNDLKGEPDEIDLSPLLYTLYRIVSEIELFIYKMHSEIEAACGYLDQFAAEYKTSTNSLVIMSEIDTKGERCQFSQLGLPFDEINEIRNFLQWCTQHLQSADSGQF